MKILRPATFALAIVAATPTANADDFAPGEKLTLIHCGRCHVINERNKYGGIGSTPSFAALRTLEDWEDRMRSFYALAPHPAFTQIEGITEPFPINRPSPIHPVELTELEIEEIIEYTRTIPPKDLGNEVR